MEHPHLISVCVFCILCATHIHCSESSESLHGVRTRARTKETRDHGPVLPSKFLEKAKKLTVNKNLSARAKRSEDVPIVDEQAYIENLFRKFKNSENKIDLNGFQNLLSSLKLERIFEDEHENKTDGMGKVEETFEARNESQEGKCFTAERLMKSVEAERDIRPSEHTSHADEPLFLSKPGLARLCPLLLYSLVEPSNCHSGHAHPHSDLEEVNETSKLWAWLYASASVAIISLCGLLGVFVIPIMGHAFYQQILQFFVALAVGTLCGDALLHLLPHAMVPHNEVVHHETNGHEHSGHGGDHNATMWKGLAVLGGLVFFFFTEKVLTLGAEWRKQKQRNNKLQSHSHVKILNGNRDDEHESVGEKLCKHKYSSYPYCYPDIKSNKDGHEHDAEGNVAQNNSENHREENGEARILKDLGRDELIENDAEAARKLLETKCKDNPETESKCGRKDGEYTVIIREHESTHHGHSHAHGHVHSPPESLSSVAWMVVLGDGLHNLTDGMAIGAAFSNNIAGGCSTAVAVFCHELPHELGDFAVLLKAGMSAKQAVFYNLISSVLCYFGMCLGMVVGDNPESTGWVFAVAAGMFLYIGLVDMFPELTTSHSAMESSFCQCSLQGLGLLSGISIMLVIAYYEDHLLNLFK